MQADNVLLYQILILVLLIFLNAFFASSEVALISLKQSAVRRLAANGGRRGRRLAQLLSNSGRFLATVQVGVTFAGFMASAFAAESFAGPLTGYLISQGVDCVSDATLEGIIVVVITILLSYVSLVFGELVPKRIAMRKAESIALGISGMIQVLVPKQLGLRYAETVALNVAGPINFLANVTAPFVWILNTSVSIVMKLFGSVKEDEQEVTEEEIRMMVDIGEEKGVIEKTEREMIHNILSFNDKTADELMIHRREITALDIDSPRDQIDTILMNAGHPRIPVYQKNIDNIIGVLHLREYFGAKLRGRENRDIRTLMKPVYLVPENVRAHVLFREMQERKITLAVLLDEFGGTAGIITIEDMVEDIVGSLRDEFDVEEKKLESLQDGVWRADGSIKLDKIMRLTGIRLPCGDYDTLAGMILSRLKTVPERGTVLMLSESSVELTVESLAGCLPGQVIIRKI